MLGDRIAALRRDAGMSQAELAGRIGVSPSTVGMYEQSRREPALDMLVKLSEVFGVSTDFLLTGRIQPADGDLQKLCLLLLSVRKRKKSVLTQEELAMLLSCMLSEG